MEKLLKLRKIARGNHALCDFDRDLCTAGAKEWYINSVGPNLEFRARANFVEVD